jgi:hypothetical protein
MKQLIMHFHLLVTSSAPCSQTPTVYVLALCDRPHFMLTQNFR